jgi:polyisoprenoid-binding protein YceI
MLALAMHGGWRSFGPLIPEEVLVKLSPSVRPLLAAVCLPAAAAALAHARQDTEKPPAPSTARVALDNARATVEFFAVGWPSALKVHGKGSGLSGTIAVAGSRVVEGRVSFALDGLATGIDLRDRHMKEQYLETARFPQATFTLAGLELSGAAAGQAFGARRVPFGGVLALHGVERPVTGEATISGEARKVNVDAGFQVRIEDFGIATPGYLGVTLADEVKVKVRFSAPVEGPA